jgi:hypothetical protein
MGGAGTNAKVRLKIEDPPDGWRMSLPARQRAEENFA